MITNNRQYKITRSQAEKFRLALNKFESINLVKDGIDPLIIQAQRDALESQLEELNETLTRYETLQSGLVNGLKVDTPLDIGKSIIEARIARNLTQKELAEILGMKSQQIQRYEQDNYHSANLKRIAEILDALSAELDCELKLPKVNLKAVNQTVVQKFPSKVMRARGWLDNVSQYESYSPKNDNEAAMLFVSHNIKTASVRVLHKKAVRISKKYDEGALIAWKARILHLARDANPSSDGMEVSKPEYLRSLAQLSVDDDGPLKAIHSLKEVGITVVVEKHLDKTYLDGAAMLLDGTYPVIGLTLRHDRLDNFWFVLFHELGHIIRHRSSGLADGFFDDDETKSENIMESEADDFARNALIPDEVWKNSFVRYTVDSERICSFAKQHNIHPAIVAGRISRERNKYAQLSGMIGRDKVRLHFGLNANIPGGYYGN